MKETANDYMKYSMLSSYRHLRSKGIKQGKCFLKTFLSRMVYHILKDCENGCLSISSFEGINAIMVHILKPKPTSGDFTNGYHEGVKKYLMRIASMGDMRAVLGKSEGPIRLLPAKMRKQIRTNPTANLTVNYTSQCGC